MTPETKKRLAYGAVIVVVGAVGIFVWKKHSTSSTSDSTSSDAAAQAAAAAQASSEETQLAELSELGSSGSSLESPQLGEETPVENFGTELSAVLQAIGLEPTPPSGSGATSSTPPTTATGSTGTTPNPVTTPTGTTPQAPIASPVKIVGTPIVAKGPIASPGGPIYYEGGAMPESVINPE